MSEWYSLLNIKPQSFRDHILHLHCTLYITDHNPGPTSSSLSLYILLDMPSFNRSLQCFCSQRPTFSKQGTSKSALNVVSLLQALQNHLSSYVFAHAKLQIVHTAAIAEPRLSRQLCTSSGSCIYACAAQKNQGSGEQEASKKKDCHTWAAELRVNLLCHLEKGKGLTKTAPRTEVHFLQLACKRS